MEREVAQAGSALGLGPRGRRFESCLPDKKVSSKTLTFFMPLYQQAMPEASSMKNLKTQASLMFVKFYMLVTLLRNEAC
jgi:hypothetical protein